MIRFPPRLRTFFHRFIRWNIKHDLDYLLSHAHPKATLDKRVLWLCDLIRWIRWNNKLPKGLETVRQPSTADRLRFLLHLLERYPEWRTSVSQTLASILCECEMTDLFATTGLSRETGLFSEITDRIVGRFLPSPLEARDMSTILGRSFHTRQDAEWIRNLPDDLISQLSELIQNGAPSAKLQKNLSHGIREALLLLAAQCLALSLRKEIRERCPSTLVTKSPFFTLLAQLEALETSACPKSDSILQTLNECRKSVDQAFFHLEAFGVSVRIVYSLETLLEVLRRMERLIQFLHPSKERSRNLLLLVGDLVEDQVQRHSITLLLDVSLRQLSRKIVERASETGEHYITRTRKEYFEMIRGGAGGGFLTAFTALLKLFIMGLHLAPFFDGLFCSLNYFLGFLGIQSLGFTLATKQPAMTAPALAGKLANIEGKEYTEFVDEVKRLVRSQFAAVLGNLIAVAPVAAIIDLAFFYAAQHHVVGTEKAHAIIASLHPFTSATIWYASITGGLLWLGSVAAGSMENWFVYRRLHEAIATHPTLVSIWGAKKMEQFSQKLLSWVSPVSANFALGFLLGMTPILGNFFGLPADVRHVTLSTASLAYAAMSLGTDVLHSAAFWFSFFGIPFIFLCNFGVSFTLAMLVAVRARALSGVRFLPILTVIGRAFRKRPMAFFKP